MIPLLNLSVLGISFVVFHDKAKRTQQENLLLHYCIERREFKGCFTGVNFQIVTSKGLRKNYCLDILRQKKVQGTVTRKFSLICHSSAKRLALMLKGC